MRYVPTVVAVAAAIAWFAVTRTMGFPLAFVAAAVLLRPSSGDAVVLWKGETDVSPRELPVLAIHLTTGIAVLLFGGVFGALHKTGAGPYLGYILTGVLCAFGLIATAAGGPSRVLAATFVASPLRGTVKAITGATDALEMMMRVHYHSTGFGRTGSVTTTTHLTARLAKSFVLATATGDITIDPATCSWSTSQTEDKGAVINGSDEDFSTRYWVPEGAEVVALTTPDGTRLIAAAPGSDPRAPLRALLAYWRGTAIGLAVITAALVVAIVARK